MLNLTMNTNKTEPKTKKWSDEQILRAYAIYQTVDMQTAYRETGIPRAVLRRRFMKMQLAQSDIHIHPAQKEIQRQAMEAAVERASFYLSDRVITLANELFDTATEAIEKSRELIKNGNSKKSNYLKALVTTWQTAIQSGQLLSNRPTSREELNIKSSNPEDLSDDQLAQIITAGKASLSQN